MYNPCPENEILGPVLVIKKIIKVATLFYRLTNGPSVLLVQISRFTLDELLSIHKSAQAPANLGANNVWYRQTSKLTDFGS